MTTPTTSGPTGPDEVKLPNLQDAQKWYNPLVNDESIVVAEGPVHLAERRQERPH